MATSIKTTVEAVNSVEVCRVLEDNGEITQIYVEASLSAQSDDARTQEIKGIVRSIIGAVAIHHNIDLDYRKIKVIDYKPTAEGETEVYPRIRIVAAYQKRFPKPQIIVELHCLSKDYAGHCELGTDPAYSTVQAFASAFNQMGFGILKLKYVEVLNKDFDKEKIVVLKVEYENSDGTKDYLMGVSEVQEDLPLAVVKASLNAVNRRIVIAS